MSVVTLQYEAFGRFDTMYCKDVPTAIKMAFEMGEKQLGKPLRVLNENGAVLVGLRLLQEKIEELRAHYTTDAQASQTRSDAHQGDWDTYRAQRHQQINDALQQLPGWGSFA